MHSCIHPHPLAYVVVSDLTVLPASFGHSNGMEEYELDYDVQEVKLWDHVFKVTTVANEALPLEMLLSLQERRKEISGQRLWEGSLLLCAYLVETCCKSDNNSSNSESWSRKSKLDLNGKSVLELGAGTGVVSMLAHRLGASPLVMTDGDERCVMMAQKNVEENDIPAEQAFVTTLRWGDEQSRNTFCVGFSEWKTRRVAGNGSSEINGKVMAPAAEGKVMAVAAVARGAALPAGGTSRNEILGDNQTPADDVVCEMAKQKETAEAPPPSLPSAPSSPSESFDFILAGDVLYKHCLLKPFLATIRDMLAPSGRLLLCHVPRAGVTHDVVERAFVEAGFAFDILTWESKENRKGDEKSCDEKKRSGLGVDATTSSIQEPGGDCDATSVGGVELCVDYARRARLYEFRSVNP